jgi:hypothetical protein
MLDEIGAGRFLGASSKSSNFYAPPSSESVRKITFLCIVRIGQKHVQFNTLFSLREK